MDALGSAFLTLISLAYLPYLILGTAIGLVIGVLPGLGGMNLKFFYRLLT